MENLDLKSKPNVKLLKLKPNSSLTPQKAKVIFRWLNELITFDGYSSNLVKCVDTNMGNCME